MTDTLEPGVLGNLVRTLGSSLNFCIYFLLGLMYQIFFNVASAQLFESETIKNFYGRVQLIIGVFMVFKLAITILQGIMDPEKFMGNKEGFGTIITRVVVALIMLAVIVPINVPDVQNANSYEKYINNNGLLFGTLYSLQDRILSGNTLGRLILGTTDTAENPDAIDQTGKTEAQIQQEKLEQSANIFSSTILKGFLRINLVTEDERVDNDETNPENWYCKGDDLTNDHRTAINMYNQLDVSPTILLSDPIVKAKCNLNWQASIPGLNLIAGDSKYVFAFNFILALIVGAIFLVLLVAFTVDIAIRSIKLAILRLLAPIPIISYVEPKSAKDGMFASWVKALTSTYLDLFLRLAIVYFVIFIIQDMMVNGIIIDQAGGMVGIISCIFIWIGLFFFARMAPKFIKDVLGLKGPGMSIIGLSSALAAVGAVRQGGTIAEAGEAFMDATRAQAEAYNQGKAAPGLGLSYNSGRDHVAKILTGDQNMSGRRMSRGARHLRRLNIDTPYANNLKQQMYDAQTELGVAQSLQKKAEKGWNTLSASDQNRIRRGYREFIDAWNANHDAAHQRSFSQAELESDGATLAADHASAKYGIAKSKYDKVEGMQKLYGQARSYEAEYEGQKDANGRYAARNFTNRAFGGLGRHSSQSRVQQWRTQNYDSQGATGSTNPTQSGVDFTAPGSMGEGGGIDGGPGGPPPGGPPPRP